MRARALLIVRGVKTSRWHSSSRFLAFAIANRRVVNSSNAAWHFYKPRPSNCHSSQTADALVRGKLHGSPCAKREWGDRREKSRLYKRESPTAFRKTLYAKNVSSPHYLYARSIAMHFWMVLWTVHFSQIFVLAIYNTKHFTPSRLLSPCARRKRNRADACNSTSTCLQ